MTPKIGDVSLRITKLYIRRFDERFVAFDRALQLRHLRLLGLDQLWRCIALISQFGIAIEISLGVRKLGLITIARGGHLVELGLVRPRIDLCEEVARIYGLPFGEVDADDLSLDLAVHDHRVVGDDRADPGQIDRHVMLSDHSGDDRHRRYRSRVVAAPAVRTGIDA